MRDVDARLRWGRRHPPGEPGWCANWVWKSLDVPAQGLPDATAVFHAVPRKHIRTGPAPRGAIVYWTGGSAGHGHVAFAMGDGREMSVDVNGPGTVGVKPFDWFAANWPALRYRGWSWYFGAINTEVQEDPPMPAYDYAYLGKPADDQTVGTKWTELDLSRYDPPRAGLEHTLVYLNVDAPVGVGVLRLRIVRADGDATGYCDFDIDGPRLITYTYFEAGDGKPTHVELRCREGLESVTLSTRYRKIATIVA